MQNNPSMTVAVAEIESDFHHYLALVGEGATVHVSSEGKIVAELSRPCRRPGGLKGRIRMSQDFDTWPEDILASFEAPLDPESDLDPDKR